MPNHAHARFQIPLQTTESLAVAVAKANLERFKQERDFKAGDEKKEWLWSQTKKQAQAKGENDQEAVLQRLVNDAVTAFKASLAAKFAQLSVLDQAARLAANQAYVTVYYYESHHQAGELPSGFYAGHILGEYGYLQGTDIDQTTAAVAQGKAKVFYLTPQQYDNLTGINGAPNPIFTPTVKSDWLINSKSIAYSYATFSFWRELLIFREERFIKQMDIDKATQLADAMEMLAYFFPPLTAALAAYTNYKEQIKRFKDIHKRSPNEQEIKNIAKDSMAMFFMVLAHTGGMAFAHQYCSALAGEIVFKGSGINAFAEELIFELIKPLFHLSTATATAGVDIAVEIICAGLFSALFLTATAIMVQLWAGKPINKWDMLGLFATSFIVGSAFAASSFIPFGNVFFDRILNGAVLRVVEILARSAATYALVGILTGLLKGKETVQEKWHNPKATLFSPGVFTGHLDAVARPLSYLGRQLGTKPDLTTEPTAEAPIMTAAVPVVR